jgi:protein-glutamine gamma-glutamyltransferase
VRTLRQTLYASLTLQVCLAAAIFAAAEEAPLALFTVPLALLSLVIIDWSGWFKPPRLLLNLAGLMALGYAMFESRQADQTESRLNQLLAGGHLVVYLTWTFLWQQKDLRRMWWMFALSVLQVAIAAVLTIQPWYGAALLVYSASTVWTMSLLSLTRAALLADPRMLSSDPDPSPVVPEVNTERPRQSLAWNGVRTDEQGRWISPRYLGGGVLTFALVLLVGLSFFVLTPRVWIGPLNVFGDSPLRASGGATGFTENVKLGDIGQVMESHELVMEVEVLHGETDQPLAPDELAAAVGVEPLFRGAVLDHYNEGSWEKTTTRNHRGNLYRDADAPIRLKISLQPLNSLVLFYPGTIQGAAGETALDFLHYHTFPQTLTRSEVSDMDSPFLYSVATAPPETFSFSEAAERLYTKNAIRLNGFSPRMQNLRSPPPDRLANLAQQVLDRSTEDGDPDSEATARVLEAYLRDSNEFSYTLDLSVQDPTIDPVEDFVFNRKRGHCEYFASALALMLRGVGIPSRIISGFKGAEYNASTGKLEVRALHAHAWVEAFVDGGWLTFDPTPGDRDTEVATKVGGDTPDLVGQTRSFWFQGMNYSKSQQEALVYAPLRQTVDIVRNNFAGLMQGQFPLLDQLKSLASSPRRWFSGTGGAVAAMLLLVIVGSVYAVRALHQRWKGWTRDRELAKRRTITVEFYARLLHLLQRFGLAEMQTLTPREFAFHAEEQFLSRFRSSGVTGTTLALVETFYAVRFGNQTLSADQLHLVELQLNQLEQCLAPPVK